MNTDNLRSRSLGYNNPCFVYSFCFPMSFPVELLGTLTKILSFERFGGKKTTSKTLAMKDCLSPHCHLMDFWSTKSSTV